MSETPTALLLALALAAGPAAAQQGKPLAEIPVRKQSNIAYVSAGMSELERREMQRIANRYPMQLIFVVEGAPPEVRGVQVTVRNLKGEKEIEALSDGPLFYLNPPSGRWTMEVEYHGEKLSRTVDLVGRRYILLEFKFKMQGDDRALLLQ